MTSIASVLETKLPGLELTDSAQGTGQPGPKNPLSPSPELMQSSYMGSSGWNSVHPAYTAKTLQTGQALQLKSLSF